MYCMLQTHLPFAVIGSVEDVKVGNKMVKARLYPWGSVQGESALKSIIMSPKQLQLFSQMPAAELLLTFHLRYKHSIMILYFYEHSKHRFKVFSKWPSFFFIFPVENENHCDFVKLREMLLRVNMEDLREQTHARHYELYRRCKLEEMGFKDTDPDSQSFRWD